MRKMAANTLVNHLLFPPTAGNGGKGLVNPDVAKPQTEYNALNTTIDSILVVGL
jgi:hypothetical protein